MAFLAPTAPEAESSRLVEIAIAAGALIGVVAVGQYLLNPLFLIREWRRPPPGRTGHA